MAITTAAIRGLITSPAHRAILGKVNDATASVADINAQPGIDLHFKELLRRVVATTATRADINAAPVDLPTKSALLAIAGV
jgi:hypothetical protein